MQTDQFSVVEVKINKPVRGFKAFIAVYANHGDHIVIGAPGLDSLAAFWLRIAGLPLEKDRVQIVNMVKADQSKSSFVGQQEG